MKRVALALVFILLVVLIWWSLRKETYTQSDAQKLDSYFQQVRGDSRDRLMMYTMKSILNELDGNGDLELSNVNLIVDIFNSSNVTSNAFGYFPNVAYLNERFETAYTSGESALGTRGRMVLRAFAWPGVAISNEIATSNSYTPFTYTSDGVPDYTSNVIAESGKTTKDMLKYCFVILDKLYSSITTEGNPWTPELIDYVNSTIPDKYSPKLDRTDNTSFGKAINSQTPSPLGIWLTKALTIGPAYIAWLAENKWRLDLDWKP